jgi:hypothetical protein
LKRRFEPREGVVVVGGWLVVRIEQRKLREDLMP